MWYSFLFFTCASAIHPWRPRTRTRLRKYPEPAHTSEKWQSAFGKDAGRGGGKMAVLVFLIYKELCSNFRDERVCVDVLNLHTQIERQLTGWEDAEGG